MKFLTQPKKRFVAIAVLLLMVCGSGYWWNHQGADALILSEPVKRGPIENTITATGKLEPRDYVEVGAQVSGQVKKLHVQEGQLVQAGDLLAEIDATLFETRVQNAAAGLEGNRAQLQQLSAELELALSRAKRNRDLHKQQAVSDDTLLESEANEKILRARMRAMEAQIKADEASLAGDQATLGYAKIYAPITGTIVSIAVREGQTINANQNAPLLLKIADLGVLTLRADVSEADVTRLKAGMPVYFKTFGGGQRRWYSQLRQVLPTPNVINDVVLYQALVDVQNDDGLLMDAMTAQVFFVLNQAKDALVIPLSAVQRNKNNSTVMRLSPSSGWQEVAVEVGVRNRTHAQILSGLSEGDRVQVGIQNRNSNTATRAFGGPMGGGRRGF